MFSQTRNDSQGCPSYLTDNRHSFIIDFIYFNFVKGVFT